VPAPTHELPSQAVLEVLHLEVAAKQVAWTLMMPAERAKVVDTLGNSLEVESYCDGAYAERLEMETTLSETGGSSAEEESSFLRSKLVAR
jgi:hypothetical protein